MITRRKLLAFLGLGGAAAAVASKAEALALSAQPTAAALRAEAEQYRASAVFEPLAQTYSNVPEAKISADSILRAMEEMRSIREKYRYPLHGDYDVSLWHTHYPPMHMPPERCQIRPLYVTDEEAANAAVKYEWNWKR
jgi:hypothetical protein